MARYDILDRQALCRWCEEPYKKDGIFRGYCSARCRSEANREEDRREQEREEYRQEAEEERRAHQAWIDSLSPEELDRLNAELEQKALRKLAFGFGLLLAGILYVLGDLARVEAPDGTFWDTLSAYLDAIKANYRTLSFWLVVLPVGLLCSETPVLREYCGRTMRVVGAFLGYLLLVSLIVYPISWFVHSVEQHRATIILSLVGLMSLMYAWTEIEGGNRQTVGTPTDSNKKPSLKAESEPTKPNRGQVAKRALYSWLVAGSMLPLMFFFARLEGDAGVVPFIVCMIVLIVTAGMGIGYSLGALLGIGVKKAESQ